MQPVSQPLIGPLFQSAYADSSFTFNDNQNNDCPDILFPGECSNFISRSIGAFVQVPDDPSNLYDVIINIDGLNDCDEFDDGDNNVDCNN